MSNILIIVSNCIYGIMECFKWFVNPGGLFFMFMVGYVYLHIFAFFFGIAYFICYVKKIKKRVIVSFFIGLVPAIICLVCLFISILFSSVNWSIKKIDLEKANDVLFKKYEENNEILKDKYIAVEFVESGIRFKLYDDALGYSLYKYDLVDEFDVSLSDEEKELLKTVRRYNIKIFDGNEIIYESIIKDKNPDYCPQMYRIKYNKIQEYPNERNYHFLDRDRKWCVEVHDIGEGEIHEGLFFFLPIIKIP